MKTKYFTKLFFYSLIPLILFWIFFSIIFKLPTIFSLFPSSDPIAIIISLIPVVILYSISHFLFIKFKKRKILAYILRIITPALISAIIVGIIFLLPSDSDSYSVFFIMMLLWTTFVVIGVVISFYLLLKTIILQNVLGIIFSIAIPVIHAILFIPTWPGYSLGEVPWLPYILVGILFIINTVLVWIMNILKKRKKWITVCWIFIIVFDILLFALTTILYGVSGLA